MRFSGILERPKDVQLYDMHDFLCYFLWYVVCTYILFLLLLFRKLVYPQKSVKILKKAFLAEVENFESFHTYLQKTVVNLSSFIASPDVDSLRKQPINSLLYVRYCGPVLQPWPFDIFFDFLHEVVSPYDLDDHQNFFLVEKIFDPQNGQKWSKFGRFWPK